VSSPDGRDSPKQCQDSHINIDNGCKTIKLCSWNINGLTEEKVSPEAAGVFMQDQDILLFQETWFIKDRTIDITNFKPLHFVREIINPKAHRGSGGISVYVKNAIAHNVHILKNYFNCIIWLSIKESTTDNVRPIALGVVYIPPESSVHNINKDDYFSILESDIARFKASHSIILLGDFNARTKCMEDYVLYIPGSDIDLGDRLDDNESNAFPEDLNCIRVSKDKGPTNNFGKKLLELCKMCDLRILNGRAFEDKDRGNFTRVESNGCSVIDYAITDSESFSYISNFKIYTRLPESDHCPVMLEFCGSNDKLVEHKELTKTGISKYICNPENVKLFPVNLMGENVSEHIKLFYECIGQLANVNDVAERWHNVIHLAMEQTFRKVQIKGKTKFIPWLDSETRKLRKDIVKNGTVCESVGSLQRVKSYKCLIQNRKRVYKKQMLDTLESACGKNSEGFWKAIKALPGGSKKQKDIDPTMVYKQLEGLSRMPVEKYFDLEFEKDCQVFLEEYDQTGGIDKHLDSDQKLMLDILNRNITVEEIVSATKKLKNNKAPGLDLIPAECVKAGIHVIKTHLEVLYNYILTNGVYPGEWSAGLRVAIPKGTDDIRPITIVPIFGKNFELILEQRLTFINEAFNRKDQYNGGFVKGSQTQDNMLILVGCIQRQLVKGEPLFVGMVDFKKAFNFINRSILFYKLIKSGLQGRCINVLKNMYSQIKAKVKIGIWLYDWIKDDCGTNQGGPLSPSMFRKLLIDLRNFLKSKHGIVITDGEILLHILWADDLLLVADSPQGLQAQFDGLYAFCSKFQLIVNTVKTKVLVFGCKDGSSVAKFNFVFNGKEIEVCNSYKYLGAIFSTTKDCRGNIFKNMVNYTVDQALKACFSVLRKCSAVGKISPKIGLHMFDACVLPILNYACEIWGQGKEFVNIERIQLKFIKMLLGVKSSTATYAVYAETGRYPIYIKQIICTVKFYFRLQNLDNSMIVKKIFNMLKDLDALGYNTWFSNIRHILAKCNLEYLLESDSHNKDFVTNCIKNLKDKLFSDFSSLCMQELHNFPVLRTYIGFKLEHNLEHYLLEIKNFKLRKILSRFRLSSHELEIEKGRHAKPKIPCERRLCSKCILGCVEDELHMLTVCPLYHKERQILYSKVNVSTCNTDKETLNVILSSKGPAPFYVAMFLYKCFKKRNEV
jgi:exonuclease III